MRKDYTLLSLDRTTRSIALVDEPVVVWSEDSTWLSMYEPVMPLALAWIAIVTSCTVRVVFGVLSH